MKSFVSLFLAALLLLAALPARAEGGIVREIPRPDLIVLEDGKSYRLAGILVPSDYAAAAIESFLLNKKVRLAVAAEAKPDRYGALPADVFGESGVWIQAELASRGLVWAAGGEAPLALRQAEEKARGLRLGFWADPAYAVKTPGNVGDYVHSFQLVEGKILDVAVKKGYVYLNFGPDWRTDFTVSLARKALRRQDTSLWRGRVVRVRGWVESRNGPMIELANPEQIEFLK